MCVHVSHYSCSVGRYMMGKFLSSNKPWCETIILYFSFYVNHVPSVSKLNEHKIVNFSKMICEVKTITIYFTNVGHFNYNTVISLKISFKLYSKSNNYNSTHGLYRHVLYNSQISQINLYDGKNIIV